MSTIEHIAKAMTRAALERDALLAERNDALHSLATSRSANSALIAERDALRTRLAEVERAANLFLDAWDGWDCQQPDEEVCLCADRLAVVLNPPSDSP